MPRLVGVGHGIVHVHVGAVGLQLADHVDHRELRRSGQSSLKVRPSTMHARALDLPAGANHQLDGLLGDELAHAVVDAPAGEDDLRVVAEHLGLVGQVVRVDADAVAADQAGPERQEVPFGAGGLAAPPSVSMPSRSKMIASSFISAMLRSRCVFSITFAASATLMLERGARRPSRRCRTSAATCSSVSGVSPDTTFRSS